MHIRSPGTLLFTLAALGACTLTGCVERRVWIDSTPPGALVWLNDAQVGRTPVDVSIAHHGIYDVRLEKEGFEPLVTSRDTDGPVWDTVPMDLVVEVMPIKAKCDARWSFVLVPRDDSEAGLVNRASALRDRLQGERAATAAPATAESK